jgi:transcription initiation factor TFIIB
VSEDGVSKDMSRAGNHGVDHDLYSDSWGRGTVIRARWTDKPSMRRMARINFYQSMNSKDRRLHHAYVKIDRNQLELPDLVMKRAKQFYKEFVEGPHLTRGKNREGILANSVYAACREAKIPRTIDEVANAYQVDRRYMSRMDDMFREVVETKHEVVQDGEVASVSHRLMIPFELPGKQRMKVVKACNILDECSKLMSRHPKTVAATALMVVMELTKQEVVAKTGVSASSITKLEQIVRDYLTKHS